MMRAFKILAMTLLAFTYLIISGHTAQAAEPTIELQDEQAATTEEPATEESVVAEIAEESIPVSVENSETSVEEAIEAEANTIVESLVETLSIAAEAESDEATLPDFPSTEKTTTSENLLIERALLSASPLSLSITVNQELPLYIGKEVSFTAIATNPDTVKKYEFWLIRSGGGRVNMYNSADSTVSWIFATPGNYDICVNAYDTNGKLLDTTSLAITVEQFVNAPTTSIVNRTGASTIFTNDTIRFTTSLNGYAGDYRYEQTLIRTQWSARISMGKAKVVDWKFFTPGLYQVETKVTDRFGRTTIVLQDLTVVRRPLVATNIVTGPAVLRVRETTRFALQYANAVGPVSFRYELYRPNNVRVDLYNGKNQEITWKFYTPATYRLVGYVTDGIGRQAQFEKNITVEPIQLSELLEFTVSPRATQEQARRWAASRNAATWMVNAIPAYWEEAIKRGLDPAIMLSISALETGNGNFIGILDASFRNVAGIKTTSGDLYPDDKAPEKTRFARFDMWRTSIKAFMDHTALYVGLPGYPMPSLNVTYDQVVKEKPGYTPDPRHFRWIEGKGKNLVEYAKIYCPDDPNYYNKVRTILTNMISH